MNYFIQSLLAGTIAFTNLTSVVEVNEKMKTGLISHTETQIEDVIYSNIYKQYLHTKINKTTDVSALNDIKIMKSNYTVYVCGNETMNKNASVKTKIDKIDTNAKKAIETFIGPDGDRSKGIFVNTDLTGRVDSGPFSTTAKKLQSMAIAYRTPGSSYYLDESVKEKIIDGLTVFYNDFFNDEELLKQYFGNWYNWEIAIPTSLSSLFVLMEDEIREADPDLIEGYVACMDQYLQNGKNGDVELTSRFHTGANLANITMNRILQGIVTQDEERIQKAVSNMMTVYAVIDPNNIVNNNTDGVYEDGSFIQHHRVAYTGSYGIGLLQGITQSVVVLGGTKYQPEKNLDTIQDWIYNCFTPVTFEGYMMEIVRGRAVSKTTLGYTKVNEIIDSMLQVIPYMDESDAKSFKEHLKYLVMSMPENVRPKSSVFSLISILPYEEIMNDSSISAKSHSKTGHYAFNSMDKNVHLRDNYAFAISRSSNRIAKYEYMSGENKRSWFQGDGAFYLYLSGRDQSKSYGAEYYAASGAYRLPGTTVPVENRQTIQEWHNGKDYYDNKELGFESGSEKQNDYVYFPVGTNHYSGSVELDGYGAAGMQLGDDNAYADKMKGLLPDDFVVYKNAEANKAWFMFDDEIVVMSSNIYDTKGRELVSTIDNRMSDTTEESRIEIGYRNGETGTFTENGSYKDVEWISYGTNLEGTDVGYYFLENKEMMIENGSKTGNLRDVCSKNSNKKVTHNFFTMTYEHGKDPQKDSYSYVILANADAEATRKYAENPQIEVLSNNEHLQAVEHKGLHMKGYMFYGAAKTKELSSASSASVMVKEEGEQVTYAISDPTFEQETIDLTINVRNAEIVEGEGVSVEHKGAVSILHVDVAKKNGKKVEVTVREKDTSEEKEELKNLIEKAEKLNEEDYTKESWKKFEEALNQAKETMSNENATIEELEASIDGLKEGIQQLREEEKGTEAGEKPKDPEGGADTGAMNEGIVYVWMSIVAAISGCIVLLLKKLRREK